MNTLFETIIFDKNKNKKISEYFINDGKLRFANISLAIQLCHGNIIKRRKIFWR